MWRSHVALFSHLVNLDVKTQRDTMIKKKKNEDVVRVKQKEGGLFFTGSW